MSRVGGADLVGALRTTAVAVAPPRRQHHRAVTHAPGRPEDRIQRLQQLVGNRAVTTLLQRHPDDGGGGGAATTGPADPLADPRIAWIDGLDTHIKANIDKIQKVKLERRVSQLTALIAAAEEKLAQAQPGKATRAAERELAGLKKLQDTTSKRRHAFMDYMACTLGGDRGTQRYWESLVHMGGGLVVHPEVAIRLKRVETKLGQHGLPMPKTSVGQSLRGDHTRNKRERNTPGMLAHAMGVAVDWFAYKNIHLKDPRLRALIETVTGNKPTMQLNPKGGTSRMVIGLGRSDTDDAPEQRAFLDKVEAEYDRLVAASEAFQAAIPDPRIKDWAREWYDHEAAIARLRGQVKRARRKDRPALQAQLEQLLEQKVQLRARLKPQLAAAFAPWRARVKVRQALLRIEAGKLGWVRIEDVSTSKGRQWMAGQVKMPKKARRKLGSAHGNATRATKGLRRLAREIDAALAAVTADTTMDRDQHATLVGELTALSVSCHTGAATAQPVISRTSVLLAKGLPRGPGRTRRVRERVPRPRDLARWKKQVARHHKHLEAATTALGEGEGLVPPTSVEMAEKRWHLVEQDVEVRKAMGGDKAKIARLQDLKRQWLVLDQLYTALRDDFEFIIRGRSVGKPTPGVAQLLGLTPGTLGGGFFGAPTGGHAKSQDPEGFGKLFFRFMAAEGFDLGASWTSGDAMHLEFEELQQRIVPPAACEEPPAPRKQTDRALAAHAKEVERREALRESRGGFVDDAVEAKRRATALGIGVKRR